MNWTLLCCCIMTGSALVVAPLLDVDQDDPFELVERAEEKHASTIAAARMKLVEAYKAEITKQAKESNLQNLNRLTTGLQLFESDGLIMEPELEGSYKEFGQTVHGANLELLTEYKEAIPGFVAANEIAQIEVIQEKIIQQGLLSQLVTLNLTSKPTLCLLHGDYKCILRDPEQHQKLNATFEMVIGLASEGIVREGIWKSGIQGKPGELVSFGAVNVPGQYLMHGNGEMRLQKVGNDAAAMANGTFKVHKGLYRSSAVSFEAFNLPDHFLSVKPDGTIHVIKRNASLEFARSATFTIGAPKFRLWKEVK